MQIDRESHSSNIILHDQLLPCSENLFYDKTLNNTHFLNRTKKALHHAQVALFKHQFSFICVYR